MAQSNPATLLPPNPSVDVYVPLHIFVESPGTKRLFAELVQQYIEALSFPAMQRWHRVFAKSNF